MRRIFSQVIILDYPDRGCLGTASIAHVLCYSSNLVFSCTQSRVSPLHRIWHRDAWIQTPTSDRLLPRFWMSWSRSGTWQREGSWSKPRSAHLMKAGSRWEHFWVASRRSRRAKRTPVAQPMGSRNSVPGPRPSKIKAFPAAILQEICCTANVWGDRR